MLFKGNSNNFFVLSKDLLTPSAALPRNASGTRATGSQATQGLKVSTGPKLGYLSLPASSAWAALGGWSLHCPVFPIYHLLSLCFRLLNAPVRGETKGMPVLFSP